MEELNSHSSKVGVSNYYQKGANERSNCIVQLNQKEGALVDVEKDERILRKRRNMDEMEKVAAIERAKKILFDDKSKKAMGKGRMRPEERNIVQEVFKVIVRGKFPGIKRYCYC